ncbi:MAG TPA: aminotransferase class V-fold PLP-dependent enzyme [Bacillota bacterium]|nr:aminotransferase class V-fold PLP-dependent enzyme [Bacillota bacterium]
MTAENSSLKYTHSVIPSLSIEEAKQLQFKLVEKMSKHFSGEQFLSLGDLGVASPLGRPQQTSIVEDVFADIFDTEGAALVRGSGTGAIRELLGALLSSGDHMFIHQAPVYSTTVNTIHSLGIKTKEIDYNQLNEIESAIKVDTECKVFYIQHARQQPTDTYELKEVIKLVKKVRPDLTIVSDDNYCVLKTKGIAVEYGADYSTFSGFKILGPEGIGVVVGKEEGISVIHERNYSGGGQVQGFEAMELLRMMTFAPVMFAIQSEQVMEVCDRLNQGEINGVRHAYVVNAQSKVIIAELDEPIAPRVIEASNSLGAATHPVGAESKYEILPMIYRVSGSFIEAQPHLKDYGIRINPMKSGASNVITILEKAIAQAK